MMKYAYDEKHWATDNDAHYTDISEKHWATDNDAHYTDISGLCTAQNNITCSVTT